MPMRSQTSAPAPSHAVREAVVLIGLGIALVGAFIASLTLGTTRVPAAEVIDALIRPALAPENSAVVVQTIRLPRAVTALLAGAALGVSGLQLQTLFRNALADPFALGVSQGASLGVALVVLGSGAGVTTAFGASLGLVGDALLIGAAIAGAMAVLAVVLAVSVRVSNPATVLIFGLMAGYVVLAGVTVLMSMSSAERLMELARWNFGSFSGVTSERLWLFAPLLFAGIALACLTTKQLNALLLGENYARSMGVAVRRARVLTMMGASVLGAVVTAFCGPVAFLGVAVPHLCRGLLDTSNHRVLVPAVALMGGVVALAAQIVSLLPGNGSVLPLNAVTAIIGAPVVVTVLMRSRRGVFAA